jgi:prolyl-tRNA synthetase
MQHTRAKNYTEWYQEVIAAADMAENSPARGCMVIKPWGFGIWERIKDLLDRRIKATGHENCYFPLFVPLSFFEKEAAHIEGFAKEMAMVTHTRLRMVDGKAKLEGELEEPLVVRPTSETIIADAFSRWIKSYRDLPVLVNQWANVVRWEMRPRLFLRTVEILWQEGHTAHSSEAEAREEALKMLEQYRQLAEEQLAIPVIVGDKAPHERFPGAVNTYTFEAMMQDGKALQSGTSHYLGQGFAKAAEIKYQDKEGKIEYVHTTSWGASTRLVGALIMAHGDDDGLRLPPALAPSQVVIVPILKDDKDTPAVMAFCEKVKDSLDGAMALGEPLRVKIDTRDRKSQDKRWDWVKKGVPLVVEVGPRDMEKGEVCVVNRLNLKEKQFLKAEAFASGAAAQLEQMQKELHAQALAYRDGNLRSDITDFAAFKAYFGKKADFLGNGGAGFVRAWWCGDLETLKPLDEMAVTVRCIPFDQPGGKGICVLTGREATQQVVFGRSY